MKLSEDHLDAIKEFINIGVGKAANILNELLEAHISLDVPDLEIVSSDKIADLVPYYNQVLSTIQLEFKGKFSGSAALIFPPNSASNLVAALTGEEVGSPDLDMLRAETLTEVGNILINGVMGAISNMLENHLDFIPPRYSEDSLEAILSISQDTLEEVLLIKTRFEVADHKIEGNIILFFKVGSFDTLIESIDSQY
jgi:chemotaxis protein CheC